jgi:hypothetical protein
MIVSEASDPGSARISVDVPGDLARRVLEGFDQAARDGSDPALRTHVDNLLRALVEQTRLRPYGPQGATRPNTDHWRVERVLAHLAAESRDESVPLGVAITRAGWTRRLVRADGAMVRAEDRVTFVGDVPADDEAQLALLDWVADVGEDVVRTDDLPAEAPHVAAKAPGVRSVMGITLPERQVLVWVRSPGPDGTTSPWTEHQAESAAALRGHLMESLYVRGRRELRATGELQRSLLPADLPQVDGWTVEARYEIAGTGLVGGDWYDALRLPSGRIALVVGDVTGHGVHAAAAMGQLRTALRAGLVTRPSAREAVETLRETALWTLPGEVATLCVVLVDPATGEAEHVSLGHPPVLVVNPDGTACWGPEATRPPLGVAQSVPDAVRLQVPEGGALVLYSDGLIERRGESIRVGLARLERAFMPGPDADLDTVVRRARDARSADDATLLVARRGAGHG